LSRIQPHLEEEMLRIESKFSREVILGSKSPYKSAGGKKVRKSDKLGHHTFVHYKKGKPMKIQKIT
jgi:hypothetical protein